MPVYELEVTNTQRATIYVAADSENDAKSKYYDGEVNIDWEEEDYDEYVDGVWFAYYHDDEEDGCDEDE